MNKYTDIIFKYKKLLLAFLIGYTLFSIAGVFQLKLDTDFALFSTDDSVYESRLEDLEETFGKLNQLIVIVDHDEFDSNTILELKNIQSELASVDKVVTVQGTAPEMIPLNGVPTPIENVPSSALLTYYETFGEFSPLKIEEDGYYSVFTILIEDGFNVKDINKVEDILEDSDFKTYISGDTYNQTKIIDYIFKILLLLPPLALIVILLVFRWQMGALKPTLLSIVPAGLGSVWTLGMVGWLGNEVSIMTAVVPIFIIVIGSADGLHFMSHYQDSKKEGKDNKTSLNETLKIVGIPMIVTTLTSMAGFLSLLSMQTESIFDLAIFSALGILLAGVATWYVLPLILTNNVNVLPKKEKTKQFDISKGLKKLWGYPSFIIVGVIIIVSLIMQSNINNEFNMLMIYSESTIVSQNSKKVQEVNGGAIPVYVYVDLGETPLSLDSMDEITDLANELANLEEVSKVVNPYALINIMYHANNTGDIPNDMVLTGIHSTISAEENNILNSLISTEENGVRLLVFPSDLNNDTLGEIETFATNYNQDASVTGVQYSMRDLNVNISDMQIKSIILALVIVLVMMIITLRSFKVALASLLPIVITVAALYGFLGVTGISLNITTVIIFSITIGVGIDYAVHFSSVYKYYLNEGFTKKEAVEKAYSNSSRPIITNALGISLGLSILMLSPLTIHFNVSVLMWASMLVSVVVTLSLLPTIFSYKKKVK